MYWQFGEVGYDYSRCYLATNGEGGDCNTKLDPKPIRWDYQQKPERKHLFDTYAGIAKLRKDFPNTFTGGNLSYNLAGAFKTLQVTHADLSVMVIGNFDVNAGSTVVTFPQGGTWYEYFTNETFTATGSGQVMNLNAGEYKFYINKNLKPVDPPDPVPTSFSMNVYPNPVRSASQVRFALPVDTRVQIEVYDMMGKRLALFNAQQSAGNRNISMRQILGGRSLSAGVYTLKFTGGQYEATRRIVIARH